MKQFEVYMADLRPILGVGEEGVRPVVVIQNNITDDMEKVICAAITSNNTNDNTSIEVKTDNGKSVRILLEQIRSLDKRRLKEKIMDISQEEVERIKEKLGEILR